MKIVLGSNSGIPGWKTFDASSGTYLDENTKFEFEDNSVECVYTSHMIEHMSDIAVQNIINESYRMLKPGGVLRICAPDAMYYINSYKTDQKAFFEDEYGVGCGRTYKEEIIYIPTVDSGHQYKVTDEILEAHNLLCTMFYSVYGMVFDKKIVDKLVNHPDELIEWVISFYDNKSFGGHKNGFYSEKVIRMMIKAGFEKTFDMPFRVSYFKEVEHSEGLDLLIRKINSFYAEGVK